MIDVFTFIFLRGVLISLPILSRLALIEQESKATSTGDQVEDCFSINTIYLMYGL
jgi:hypothetical protein